MAKEDLNTTNKFILPQSGDNGSDEARKQMIENLQKITPEDVQALSEVMAKENESGINLLSNLEWIIRQLPSKDQERLLKVLLHEKENGKKYIEPNSELVGNFDKVLEYIMNYCVEKLDTYMLVGNGTMFTINLPAVGEFEGFKFRCFIGSGNCSEDSYLEDINGSSMGYSMDDIGEILQKINEFLMEYGVGDKDITDFSDLLKSWVYGRGNRDLSTLPRFGAGVVFEKILGGGGYRLTDKVPASFSLHGRVVLYVNDGGCDFRYSEQYYNNGAHIIFKL